MKMYVIRKISDRIPYGLGEYVNISGIYTNKEKARKRLKELKNLIDEKEEFNKYRYIYDILEIETDKDIDIFLGGYCE